MEDPYKRIAEDISKAMTKVGGMICWIAQRTLTKKEFDEFVEKFAEKPKDGIDEFLWRGKDG